MGKARFAKVASRRGERETKHSLLKKRPTFSNPAGGEKKAAVQKKDDGEPKQRKKRRFRPGTRALMDIRRYQRSQKRLSARTKMENLIRATLSYVGFDMFEKDYRIQPEAISILHETAEAELTDALWICGEIVATCTDRITPDEREMRIVKALMCNNSIFGAQCQLGRTRIDSKGTKSRPAQEQIDVDDDKLSVTTS